ncbi:MAG: polyprenyl synthetase family protein [Zavarzinella sp.]
MIKAPFTIAHTPFAESLPHVGCEVLPDLARVDEIFLTSLDAIRGQFPELFQHVRCYHGKRLRPILMLLAARACGQVTSAHNTLAAVVELIHTATLVHDDILDNATSRRDVATIHQRWGNKAAILLGDFLFSEAYRLCSTIDATAGQMIGEATSAVCLGEMQQTFHAGNLHLRLHEYEEMIAGKTGALTAVATRMGAYYAGASPSTVATLTQFGRQLGVLFQMADDILDLTGSEQETGKTLGTDLAQKKLTLPLIMMLEKLHPEDKTAAREAIEGNNLRQVRYFLQLSQAIEHSYEYANNLMAETVQNLNNLPDSAAKSSLNHLIRLTLHRSR